MKTPLGGAAFFLSNVKRKRSFVIYVLSELIL